MRDLDDAGERLYQRSDAALAILHDVGGVWRVLSWARVIPRVVRDAVYGFIAKRRYRWFGKLDACRLPGPEDDRFLP